jgi:hypothetical protein
MYRLLCAYTGLPLAGAVDNVIPVQRGQAAFLQQLLTGYPDIRHLFTTASVHQL